MKIEELNQANELIDRIAQLRLLRKFIDNVESKPLSIKVLINSLNAKTTINDLSEWPIMQQYSCNHKQINESDNQFILDAIDQRIIWLESELDSL